LKRVARIGENDYIKKRKKKETGKEKRAMPHAILNESLLYIDYIYT
jgi:hypothetical protein